MHKQNAGAACGPSSEGLFSCVCRPCIPRGEKSPRPRRWPPGHQQKTPLSTQKTHIIHTTIYMIPNHHHLNKSPVCRGRRLLYASRAATQVSDGGARYPTPLLRTCSTSDHGYKILHIADNCHRLRATPAITAAMCGSTVTQVVRRATARHRHKLIDNSLQR